MSINAAIAGRLPYLQRQAESMMTDTCTIVREGTPTFDPTTGKYTTPTSPIYSGKCRIRTRGKFLRDRPVEAGDTEVILWPYTVSIPVTAPAIEVLDVVTVTAAADAALVDVQMHVRISGHATAATARRLDCEEVAP